ncbi:cupin domain-containing protein [Tateyamaria omphalii]|uniref:cupin domain-containing protein n=1 Tax=Tateyamaria omphalii TaxID=299262 RepID=UPI001C991473|nr:cupin domain-containing protein [Tateyamaria omphalii]MBY5933140.1 cupin domain-containing protein [Tateyamaria omphalii]
MKRFVLTAIALLMAGNALAQDIAREEIRRTAVPGSDTMEVVVFRLTVPVGATIPLHTHPGDEHTVVVTDARAEAPNGNIVEFAVGTPLYFPEGQVHGGLTNVGDAPMVAITTFVVRKGEPLTVLAN